MAYVNMTREKVEQKADDIAGVIWEVDEMNDQWENANENFAKAIDKQIGKLGVNKNSYETKFKLLDIEDMRKQIIKCKNCNEGLFCEEHRIKRQNSYDKMDPKGKRKNKDIIMSTTAGEVKKSNLIDYSKGDIQLQLAKREESYAKKEKEVLKMNEFQDYHEEYIPANKATEFLSKQDSQAQKQTEMIVAVTKAQEALFIDDNLYHFAKGKLYYLNVT